MTSIVQIQKGTKQALHSITLTVDGIVGFTETPLKQQMRGSHRFYLQCTDAFVALCDSCDLIHNLIYLVLGILFSTVV